MCLVGLVSSSATTSVSSSSCVASVTVCGCKSIVHPFSDRKLMVSSFVSHQISTSFLVGKSGSSCVSVGSVYCSMKTFVTYSRSSSRFCESCVGLPTCLYVVTLNCLLRLYTNVLWSASLIFESSDSVTESQCVFLTRLQDIHVFKYFERTVSDPG